MKKTNETSTRELALELWNSLPQQEQKNLFRKYVNSGKFTMALSKKDLTGSEIEYILLDYKPNQKQYSQEEVVICESCKRFHYKGVDKCYCGSTSLASTHSSNGQYVKSNKQYSQEEVDEMLDRQAARTTAQVLKNNQKQFKEFNVELFKTYINKFSEEDKLKAFLTFKNELSDLLRSFAEKVDESYRPYTRDNLQGCDLAEEFIKNLK